MKPTNTACLARLCRLVWCWCAGNLKQRAPRTIVGRRSPRWVLRTYMNGPKYVWSSIHVGSKIKVASVYPDFECGFGLLSLMEFAG